MRQEASLLFIKPTHPSHPQSKPHNIDLIIKKLECLQLDFIPLPKFLESRFSVILVVQIAAQVLYWEGNTIMFTLEANFQLHTERPNFFSILGGCYVLKIHPETADIIYFINLRTRMQRWGSNKERKVLKTKHKTSFQCTAVHFVIF